MSMLPGAKRAEHAQPRNADDWYIEPPSCVHHLFDAVEFSGPIHDPACGSGTIPRVAAARGYQATGSDIRNRGFAGAESGVDFLQDWRSRSNIVTNPPYLLAEAFVHHALAVVDRKLAVVVRTTFLNGQRRFRSLFKPFPPSQVVILSQRPSMPPGGTDVPAKGGTIDYVWIVYDRDYSGPTLLKWIAP